MTSQNPGPPRYVREFVGPEGLAAMSGTQTAFSPVDLQRFRARIASIPLVTTRIIDLQITPHRERWAVGHGEEQGLPRALHLVIPVVGRTIGHHGGRMLSLEPGSITLLRSGAEYHAVAATASRTLSFWMNPDQLGAAAAEALPHVSAVPLQEHSNARGATAIVRSLVGDEPGPESAAELERLLIGMVEGLILAAEARERDGEGVTRELFAELSALLLADPARADVRQGTLAAELGVSIGRLQRAVQAQGTTVGALAREVRIDAVAARLRDRSNDEEIAAIAQGSGFGGYTQLARVFRERTGMTMGEYRTLTRL